MDTFERVERAAKRLGVSRSEFYARAAQSWLDALEDENTTNAINDAIVGLPAENAIHRCCRCRPCLRQSRLMHRGEVWWADLGLPRGSAPALRRPVLIISGDPYNRSSLSTVTVAVLTGNARLAALPGNVAISTEFAEIEADSVVNVTQIATIDREALEERVTHAARLADGSGRRWLATGLGTGAVEVARWRQRGPSAARARTAQASNGAMRTASGRPHRTNSPKRPCGTAAASARIMPASWRLKSTRGYRWSTSCTFAGATSQMRSPAPSTIAPHCR